MPYEGTDVNPQQVAKWFIKVGVLNALLAVLFIAPFLIPAPGGASDLFVLAFAVANFPGTWALFAYAFFLIVGVLGMIGWGMVYYLLNTLFEKKITNKMMALTHLGATLAGVYGATIFFFLAGFIGGRAMLPPSECAVLSNMCMGAGLAIVNALISWTVIPTALSMVITAFGTLIGIGNVILTYRND